MISVEKNKESIGTLFVFDFDDTLADTSAEIGVQRIGPSGAPDKDFGIWLEENNIVCNRITSPKSNPFFWLSSANFALYESYDYADEKKVDVIDYSKVGSSEDSDIHPISRMVSYFKKAISEEDSKVIVLTARSPLREAFSPAMKKHVKCDNKRLIQGFLASQGVRFPIRDIYAVGDKAVHSSVSKARVVLEKICDLNPEEVIFFDDNFTNLRAVSALNKIPLDTTVITYQVYDGGKIRKFDFD